MRVLVTGGSGLLGKYVIKSSNPTNTIYSISRNDFSGGSPNNFFPIKLNLVDTKELSNLLNRINPDVIIHTAAEGNVDAVQNCMHKYFDLNVNVATFLADYSKNTSTKLIFISSNSVFGGSEEVYSDYSETSPINDYGMLKAHAEKMVLSIDPNSIIIRPLLMYGWPNFNRRLNPVVKWINDLRLGINIRVVNDIFTQPLAVWDCATAIWKGIEIDASGPVNISGGESISLYNFALLTSEIFGLNSGLIQPVSSLYFQNLAPRPFKTSFDLNRLKTEFNFVPSKLRAGIEELKLTENKIV